MRITDLLDKNSICLDASPADKTEALNQIVSLMGKSGKINDIEAYRKQLQNRDLQLWSSKMVLILILWTANR